MTQYNKTPLKEVIVRIDFDKISLESIKTFSEAITGDFEHQAYNRQANEIVNINKNLT